MRPSTLLARVIAAPPPPDLQEPFDPDRAVGIAVWLGYVALAAIIFIELCR